MGKKHFCFFETAETGNRTPNSGVKGSGANHYPRAPAHMSIQLVQERGPASSQLLVPVALGKLIRLKTEQYLGLSRSENSHV